MDGQNSRGFKWIAFWLILIFFKFISVYIKMSFTQLENHFRSLCGRDFANERLLLCLAPLKMVSYTVDATDIFPREEIKL